MEVVDCSRSATVSSGESFPSVSLRGDTMSEGNLREDTFWGNFQLGGEDIMKVNISRPKTFRERP